MEYQQNDYVRMVKTALASALIGNGINAVDGSEELEAWYKIVMKGMNGDVVKEIKPATVAPTVVKKATAQPAPVKSGGSELKEMSGKIEEVGQKENKISLKVGGRFYSFFKTKQDGNYTKAYNQYMEKLLQAGDDIAFTYKETPNPDGKYPYKNIMFFNENLSEEGCEPETYPGD